MPTFTSLAASSSSSIAQGDVIVVEVNSIQKRLMEDLSRLSRMLQRIQAVLHDAEEREIYDKAIQLWLNELREVAYDAEDVLDQYEYEVIKTQLEEMTATAEAKPSLKGNEFMMMIFMATRIGCGNFIIQLIQRINLDELHLHELFLRLL
ncbi:hypothetical protein M5K25_009198 [Dendrobium thyrsiflorum]|uniref:Disease resistance N-terminal domain-containing protein n=1 Tax=Dendrobium thyrsiflorum TaxID=117978 RepID=A0ABD0V5P2_DENTH